MTQRFSVVLPVRNRSDSIGRAVVSILAQTFADVELIVADANSDDDTLEAVRTVADRRVSVVRGSTLNSARAAGLRAAAGDWVAQIDADTVARPQWLARSARLADRSDADMVCCGGTQHHWDHSTTEILPTTALRRPGAVLTRRVRHGDPHIVSTPELLLDWHETTATMPGSTDERRLRWAVDALTTLGDSPIPTPDLLAHYATVAGVSAARLQRHTEARRLLAMAAGIRRYELRSWVRFAVASVPALAERIWVRSGGPVRADDVLIRG